jgi:ABC-type transport system involved in multi-copper enzyme maturation permease subunit
MYAMIFAELGVVAFFTLLMPSFMYTSENDGPNNCYLMITFTSCILIPFFSSVIAEINANASERIFVLSSPNKRWVYLTSKILSSLTINLVILAIIIGYVYGIYHIMGPTYGPRVFAPVSPGFFCLNLFELNIFGTIIGSCFRYYFKEIMTSIIVLLAVMLYTITFAISGQWYGSSDMFHFDLQYIILPPSI